MIGIHHDRDSDPAPYIIWKASNKCCRNPVNSICSGLSFNGLLYVLSWQFEKQLALKNFRQILNNKKESGTDTCVKAGRLTMILEICANNTVVSTYHYITDNQIDILLVYLQILPKNYFESDLAIIVQEYNINCAY